MKKKKAGLMQSLVSFVVFGSDDVANSFWAMAKTMVFEIWKKKNVASMWADFDDVEKA